MNKFKIDETTGVIRTNERLDRETHSTHLLCVNVSPFVRRKRSMEEDLQKRTNHHEVLYILVNVLDANDEGPNFEYDLIEKGEFFTVKFQNFGTAEISAAIYLKFKQRGQT